MNETNSEIKMIAGMRSKVIQSLTKLSTIDPSALCNKHNRPFMKKFLRKPFLITIAFVIATLFSMQKSFGQGSQTFSTAGTFTNGFTVPAGVTSITVRTWGGGGGGAIDATNNNGAPGGGGGAYASSVLTVVPGTQFTVVVGAGGSGGINGGAAATAGGQSSFGTLVIALGGGFSTSSTAALGGQASGSTGQIKFSGGNSGIGSGTTTNVGGSGGGSSASASGNGVNGSNFSGATGGAGGNGPDGDGGRGGDNAVTTGANAAQPGTAPGGGGGGRGDNGGNSAAGAPGRVIISWTCPTATISYSASTFCKSITSATANITGTTGGTFSATPAGLSINSTTGEINPSTSTAGTYTVHYQIASGGNGCTAVDATFSVTIGNIPLAAVTNQTNITCFAANDGTITVSASGGTSPYTFSVDNGTNYLPATGTNLRLFTGLLPNIAYRIKVKDNNGCVSK